MHILLGILIILFTLQFLRPEKNVSEGPQPKDITTQVTMTPEIKRMLEVSCYDCHSNNTRYPWYAQVQPVGWYLGHHIKDSKRHLNFSTFAALPIDKAKRKLNQIADEVADHEMPLTSYTLMHKEAKLSPEQVKQLAAWARLESQFYPSLPAQKAEPKK